MKPSDLKALPLGHKMDIGQLAPGVAPGTQISVTLVETAESHLLFDASYMGVRLGRLKYDLANRRWGKTWN